MPNILSRMVVTAAIGGIVSCFVLDYSSWEGMGTVAEPTGQSGDQKMESGDSTFLDMAVLSGHVGPGHWESFEAMHERYTKAFVDSEGFGIDRRMTYDEPSRRSLLVNGVPHRVESMSLIGMMHGEPVAYAASWLNVTRNGIDRYERRPLTGFEESSLDALKQGQPFTWSGSTFDSGVSDLLIDSARGGRGSVINEGNLSKPGAEPKAGASLHANGTLIAALRATASCVPCHEVSEGQLLGAFVYGMQPIVETPAVLSLGTSVDAFGSYSESR